MKTNATATVYNVDGKVLYQGPASYHTAPANKHEKAAKKKNPHLVFIEFRFPKPSEVSHIGLCE